MVNLILRSNHYNTSETTASTRNIITNQRTIVIVNPAIPLSPSIAAITASTKKVRAHPSKPAIFKSINPFERSFK